MTTEDPQRQMEASLDSMIACNEGVWPEMEERLLCLGFSYRQIADVRALLGFLQKGELRGRRVGTFAKALLKGPKAWHRYESSCYTTLTCQCL